MATQGGNDSRQRNNNYGKNQQMRVGGLRKGPWTPEEDAILKDYVTKNGEGNWNALQKFYGLNRCNKSCRLRWLNHLRPNLKKGAISAEEEAIIVYLHKMLGNKWAYIASQLSGRTDNEIKNFWHTRCKKRQRANLLLYPNQSDMEEINNNMPSTPKISINPSPSSLQSLCMTTLVQPPIYEKFSNMPYSSSNNADQIYSIYPQNNNNSNNNYVNHNYSLDPQNSNNNVYGFNGQLNEGFINNHNSSLTFNLDSNPNPPLFGSRSYEQNSYDQDFSWDHEIGNEGPISLNDLSLYDGQNFMKTNNFHESSSSLSAMGSTETNTLNCDFFNSLDNFSVTGGPMPHWDNRAEPVPTVQLSTSFNGVHQITMPNWQELLNSSNSMAMATSTMTFNGVHETAMTENRKELINPLNSMAMETPRPFMDNYGNWNILPGSVHQAFNDNGDCNILDIEW